jgi:hypothetical protein
MHRRVNLQNHCINLPGKRFDNRTVRARIDKKKFFMSSGVFVLLKLKVTSPSKRPNLDVARNSLIDFSSRPNFSFEQKNKIIKKINLYKINLNNIKSKYSLQMYIFK